MEDYDGKKLEDEPEEETQKKEKKQVVREPVKTIKDILGERIEKVVSDRIVDSPCCLLTAMNGYVANKKIMEINPDHGIAKELRKRADAD